MAAENDGFVDLFNGKDLSGWRASEHQGSFSVVDGQIKVKGPRSHLFYTGDVGGGSFKNFIFEADVMTLPNSNSGIFIHTSWQESGWPSHGYECQVNNSMSDPQRTGGLYNTVKINPAPAEDNKWFHYRIQVEGRKVDIHIDDKHVVDYTEPENKEGTIKLSSGTFALQAHDPNSTVFYKNIRVKVLP